MGLAKFIVEYGRLKRTLRTGWVAKGIAPDLVESVADHTARTALIALVLAEAMKAKAKVNLALVLKMALLHDLPEVALKDIDKEAWSYIAPNPTVKRKAERRVLEVLFTHLPQNLRREYGRVWGRYRGGVNLECRIVNTADRLELAFQAYEYTQLGYPEGLLADMWEDAEEAVRKSGLPVAGEILKELRSLAAKTKPTST